MHALFDLEIGRFSRTLKFIAILYIYLYLAPIYSNSLGPKYIIIKGKSYKILQACAGPTEATLTSILALAASDGLDPLI